jgi:hypothetical protein
VIKLSRGYIVIINDVIDGSSHVRMVPFYPYVTRFNRVYGQGALNQWSPCPGYCLTTYRSQFQQETMASQIRHFKTRNQQLRHSVERLKRDVAELKKYTFTSTFLIFILDGAILTSELMAFFKAKTTNCECKRIKDMMIRFLLTLSTRMESVRCRRISNFIHSHILFNSLIAPSFDYSNKRPTTNSSPHSIPTPLGPNRLTLAHGQQLPQISSREQHNPGLSRSHAHGQENQSHFSNTLQRRPISSRSLE